MLDLGPIIQGGESVLDHDLTHATSGLDRYPAFDTGWREGDVVVAPERVTVTRRSGGPWAGWSFYATGDSGLRYYITHLRYRGRPSVGSVVGKGGRLGVVGDFKGGRVPHAHVGVNVEMLLGLGAELAHNTNYTHGQPTVGEQLRALLAEEVPVEPWVPEFIEWYLFNRDGKRPASAPSVIPDRVWRVVRLAARYRAEKPGDEDVEMLRAKIEAAKRALA